MRWRLRRESLGVLRESRVSSRPRWLQDYTSRHSSSIVSCSKCQEVERREEHQVRSFREEHLREEHL